MNARIALRSVVNALPLVAVLIVAAILTRFVGSPSIQRVFVGGCINLAVVLGLQMFSGNSGVVSLGHVSHMGVGAYVTAILATPVAIKASIIPDAPLGLANHQFSTASTIAITLVVVGVFAAITGVVVTRQVGISATIVSLALLVVTHNVIVNWVGLTRGARAFYGVPTTTTMTSALALCGLGVVAARVLRDSPAGLQLRASSEDPLAAASMGANLRQLRWFAWLFGALVVGLAGSLYTSYLGTISPDAFYFHTTFLTLAMLLLGGARSTWGAVVGAIFVTAGYEIMRNLETGLNLPLIGSHDLPGLADFFLGAVIVLVMVFRPSGLVGDDELDERWRRWRRAQPGSREAVAEAHLEETAHA